MKFTFIDETNQSFINNTDGKGEIYFAIIGNNESGQTCHLNKDGDLIPCHVSDNNVPINNENWCNYSYTINEVPQIEVPHIDSGRAYISLGSPMFFKISHANTFIQPDTANPSDPNVKVYFDWIEFTFDDRGFHGNTTQVDQFGFPMIIELIATDGYRQQAGILEDRKRSDLFAKYADTVPEEFKSLVQKPDEEKKQPFRIIAPFKGSFGNGGDNATYFDDYISRMWRYYTKYQLELTIPQGTFIGKVENNIFTFTKADSPDTKYTINYPKSWEVFECSGVFAIGDGIQKAIQAQISAMFNRHILEHPEKKCEPTEYYKEASANYYAEFWHLHSINKKAYGFPFDDVCEQSTLLEHTVPRELKVTIRWD
ncbi:MAG: hypothetical protein KME31_31970 [Tolypothrix carrinoi HA7290-LM1]|jgi:hypothetical protein|nr:hypothetical protein [Tolypothrix carrinoi HA7290-LM1]